MHMGTPSHPFLLFLHTRSRAFLSPVSSEDAIELYRAFALPYIQQSTNLMERCLCDVTRISIDVVLSGLPPFYGEEKSVSLLVDNIRQTLERRLDTDKLTEIHWTCFAMGTVDSKDVVSSAGASYWLHWPCLAMVKEDLSDALCNELLAGIMPPIRNYVTPGCTLCREKKRPPSSSIKPRNRATYYPMYGSEQVATPHL